jgi:hypothetical protein
MKLFFGKERDHGFSLEFVTVLLVQFSNCGMEWQEFHTIWYNGFHVLLWNPNTCKIYSCLLVISSVGFVSTSAAHLYNR